MSFWPPVLVDNARGHIVDSTDALDLQAISKTMDVVGRRVIRLEMGSVWSQLGAKLMVIKFMDWCCPAMEQK